VNPWGALIAAAGLVLLFVAIRNSYGNLLNLVPGSGGASPTVNA
jgi:hypothetical protein